MYYQAWGISLHTSQVFLLSILHCLSNRLFTHIDSNAWATDRWPFIVNGEPALLPVNPLRARQIQQLHSGRKVQREWRANLESLDSSGKSTEPGPFTTGHEWILNTVCFPDCLPHVFNTYIINISETEKKNDL